MHATVRYHKLKPPEPIKTYKSTVGKKMAAVHFTTRPCEPNIAYKAQRKPNFYSICPCTKDIVLPRFEDFLTLLYVFTNVVKVLCAKNDG